MDNDCFNTSAEFTWDNEVDGILANVGPCKTSVDTETNSVNDIFQLIPRSESETGTGTGSLDEVGYVLGTAVGEAGTLFPLLTQCENATSELGQWFLLCANATTEYGSGNGTLSGNDTGIPPENVYSLPWWQQLVWTMFFAGMVVVATGGNLIVVWIVLTHKRMRSVTNYFLVNLSFADTMVSTLNVIFNFVFMISGDWYFGEPFCKISNFVAVLSVSASVFTMMAISFDRYIAIMSPLRPRMSKTNTLIIAFVIWLGSSTLSLPNLLFSQVFVHQYYDGTYRSICYLRWPDGDTTDSYQEYVYNVLILVFTYLLPISCMVFTYTRIGHELWGSQSIGECVQIESVKNKRRVVKMMIVVVIIFAICWLPYHVYFIIVYYDQNIIHHRYIQNIYLGIYWLAMSNSMYNPIIYCWMNSRFRHGFKQVFRWCPGITINEAKSFDRVDQKNVRYSCSHSPEMTSRVERDGLVHISLHTLTESGTVCDNGQTNGGRQGSLGSSFLFRKLREKRPSAV